MTRILIVLEEFNAEHGLWLDFFGRLELLEVALDAVESTLGDAPTH